MAKIVVIDDSQAAIAMLEPILIESGHTMDSYNSGIGLERKIEADPPQLIISDIVMPERNGYDILRSLKRHSILKSIPVILMSTKGEETDIRWGMRLGAADYIIKPFDKEKMLLAIDNALNTQA